MHAARLKQSGGMQGPVQGPPVEPHLPGADQILDNGQLFRTAVGVTCSQRLTESVGLPHMTSSSSVTTPNASWQVGQTLNCAYNKAQK